MTVAIPIRDRFAGIVPGRLKLEEPLGPYTTLRVGGPAEFLATATSIEQLVALTGAAREAGIPWRVIGRGSNLLVADRGVRGLVVRCTADQVSVVDHVVHADAGVSCANLAGRTARLGLGDLEFAVAIPGTIGGAVVQDAGAHGTEMRDVLDRVEYLDADGSPAFAPPEALAMAYRTSRFKRGQRREVILRASLRLRAVDPAKVTALIAEIRSWRQANQPTEPSAGSIFTNPPGDYAGRLVEAAGLKGRRLGNAQISERHANFVVNHGGARSADVDGLIRLARAEVLDRFGVELEAEVERFGDWDNQ